MALCVALKLAFGHKRRVIELKNKLRYEFVIDSFAGATGCVGTYRSLILNTTKLVSSRVFSQFLAY